MYSQTQDNGSSCPLFDQYLSQFTELELETSSLVGCGNHYSGGSGCSSSYVSSPSSNSMGPATVAHHPPSVPFGAASRHLFQRSISSLSLHKGASSSLLGLPEDPLDDGPVRRAYSAGDLESVSSYIARRRRQRPESPLSVSNENTLIIEGIMKATKYSPEEKRERIERYRNKRNQRNFHKKIQYTCRKTLADSRPRVKGRFVRNDEISNITTTMETMDGNSSSYDGNCYLLNDQYSSIHYQQQRMMMSVGVDEEDAYEDNNWINLLDYSYPSQYEH